MQIPKGQLEKFKLIMKESGINLTDEQAREEGLKLLTFFKAIYKPISIEEYEQFKK